MVFRNFLEIFWFSRFLGFKRWNYTVRWVVNGTILKGFDAMAPFFGALLVFSSTLSWWEMVENLSRWEMVLFGGVEAESSPEDYHFRGDRTQNDGDVFHVPWPWSLLYTSMTFLKSCSCTLYTYVRFLRGTKQITEFVVPAEFRWLAL